MSVNPNQVSWDTNLKSCMEQEENGKPLNVSQQMKDQKVEREDKCSPTGVGICRCCREVPKIKINQQDGILNNRMAGKGTGGNVFVSRCCTKARRLVSYLDWCVRIRIKMFYYSLAST